MSGIHAFIQARMGSKRLPGKSLLPVYGDWPLLEMIIARVKKSAKLDGVVLVTSDDNNCDPLDILARQHDVCVVRGSEEDVLGRFCLGVKKMSPKAIVRICADNPLISPEEIDRLITFFLKEKVDYAANNTRECGLADGLGCEIVDAQVLMALNSIACSDPDREHVTTYIKKHPENFAIGWLHAPEVLCFPDAKLDIDTASDLERMRCFCKELPPTSAPFWSSLEITNQAREFFSR